MKKPKFALINVLDKEQFMAEVEKGLVKESYGRIGKDENNKGEVVEEVPTTDTEKQAERDTKWLDKKSSLIYTIDFSRGKPTEWN